jgi:hypothetical protein
MYQPLRHYDVDNFKAGAPPFKIIGETDIWEKPATPNP